MISGNISGTLINLLNSGKRGIAHFRTYSSPGTKDHEEKFIFLWAKQRPLH